MTTGPIGTFTRQVDEWDDVAEGYDPTNPALTRAIDDIILGRPDRELVTIRIERIVEDGDVTWIAEELDR